MISLSPSTPGYSLVSIFILFHLTLLGQGDPGQNSNVSFYQSVDVTNHRGKRFTVEARVKTGDDLPTNSKARLYAMLDKEGGTRVEFANMQYHPILASDWKVYSFLGKLDEQARTLSVGGRVEGNGRFYFDDFKLKVEVGNGQWEEIPLANSGFEEGLGDRGLPLNWQGELGERQGFTSGLITEAAFPGTKALQITGRGIASEKVRPNRFTLGQSVDVTAHRGKSFILRVAVKGRIENGSSARRASRANIWASVLDVNGMHSYRQLPWGVDINMWSVYEVKGEISDLALELSFGLTAYGGCYSFDAFQLLVKKDNGKWESIPISNAGFEDSKPKNELPGGWQPIVQAGNMTGRVVSEDAYEGKYAYQIKEPGSTTQSIPTAIPAIVFANEPDQTSADPEGVLNTTERAVIDQFLITKRPLAEKGLSTQIDNIFEDRNGFLWFTTQFELVRYDGDDIRKYVPPVSDSSDFSGFIEGVDILEDINNNLWLNSRAGVYQFDLRQERFTYWSADKDSPNYLNDAENSNLYGTYSALATDDFGNIYIGSSKGLVQLSFPDVKKNGKSHLIRRFPGGHSDSSILSLPHDQILDLFKDRDGHIWVGSARGLSKISIHDGQVKTIENYAGPSEASAHYWRFQIIKEDEETGRILIFCQGSGMGRLSGSGGRYFTTFDPGTKSFIDIYHQDEEKVGESSARIHETDIIVDPAGTIWFGTIEGLFYGDSLASFQKLPLDGALFQPRSIHADRDGNIWIGSHEHGLYKISRIRESTAFYPMQRHFSAYKGPKNLSLIDLPETMSFFSKPVAPIANAEDREGNLWINVRGRGLYFLGKERENDPTAKVHWTDNSVGIRLYGDRERGVWTNYRYQLFHDFREIFPRGINYGNAGQQLDIYAETAKDELIVGSSQYFMLMDKTSYAVQPINFGQIDFTKAPFSGAKNLVHVDDQGRCWVINKGMIFQFEYRPDGTFPLVKKHNAGQYFALCSQIHDDDRGNLWLATNNGLLKLDKRTDEFTPFTETQNIGTPYFLIAPEGEAFLWLISTNGNFRFNLATGKIDYSFKLDLQDVQLNNLPSAFKPVLSSGEIFIPAKDGFYLFDPETVSVNNQPPSITFSNLWINNEEATMGEDAPLTASLNYLEEIELPHDQNNLAIRYAAHHLLEPDQYNYAYFLENWENDWNYVGHERVARYPQLSPGKYVFKVKAANPNGIWNETGIQLHITIFPPWWWSLPAKLGYAVLFVIALFGIYQFQLRRRLAKAETLRLRELDEVKTRLYANITHEFRTPLTIILGMADKVAGSPNQWLSQGVSMIKRNGQKLLRLVNQLLDLSKLEAGKLELKMIQGNVIPYLRYVLESFASYAAVKNIQVHFHSKVDRLNMDYDPDHLLNVLSNLLSNAVKFTGSGGDVYVIVGSRQSIVGNGRSAVNGWESMTTPSSFTPHSSLLLQVIDTGVGIPEEKLPHIFDRFYQTDSSATREGEGTGIGLALTKELVQLMGGSIAVKSRPGTGTEFTVLLPVTTKAPSAGFADKVAIKEEAKVFTHPRPAEPVEIKLTFDQDGQKNSLLIVEDSKDVVQYLVACLEGDYQLEIAHDGEEGIRKALELAPDIIISDVMMPKKDGFELCHALKSDMSTSHIPIVLLTAKADVHSRITGLRRGADAYLAKPFNEQELQVRMRQLLALRLKLRQKYGDPTYLSGPASVPEESDTPLEDEFLVKMRQVVADHLDDYDFDVSKLCREMGMSRTPVHNKLKALMGKSTTEFIRQIRLEKARELLLRTELNVSEIAYETGFRNPRYFSRMFGRVFGVSPTEYREAEDDST